MPSLGFQQWKADKVEANESRQTIRPERKNPIKVGDKLYLFRCFRTKSVKHLNPAGCLFDARGKAYVECKSVERIRMENTLVSLPQRGISVSLNFGGLVEAIALADGFNDKEEMINFFKKQYALPFKGVIITW